MWKILFKAKNTKLVVMSSDEKQELLNSQDKEKIDHSITIDINDCTDVDNDIADISIAQNDYNGYNRDQLEKELDELDKSQTKNIGDFRINFDSASNGEISPRNEIHDTDAEIVCRVCFENIGPDEDYLNPCRCSGTSKWIHRECLNQWRATANNQEAFYKCFSCNYRYRLQEKTTHKNCWTKCNLYLARHPFVFYLLNLIVIFVLTTIIGNLDSGLGNHERGEIPKFLGYHYDNVTNSYNVFNHGKEFLNIPADYLSYYWVFAAFVYLIIFILLFLINLVCTKNRYLYLKFYGFYGRQITLMICSVILINIFSLVLGTLIMTIFMQTIIWHHYVILERSNTATEHEVLPYSPES